MTAVNPDPVKPPSASLVYEAARDATRTERLKALWKLSTRYELDDDTRIRAVLRMAAETLNMDLAILGKFDKDHTLHYVYDALGVVSEGMVLQLQDSMCLDVYNTKAPLHVADLTLHSTLQRHPMVTEAGLHVYSGLPVNTGSKAEWVLAFLRRSTLPAIEDDDHIFMELVADWLGNALHNSAQKNLLQQLALTDLLTGLPNRRAAEERLQQELARAQRQNGGFALALVDLDHFKRINDRYGHAIGDQVLKEVSRHLQAGLRDGDWVARWGGEEFLFFLYDSHARDAVYALERLAEVIKNTPIHTDVGVVPLTLSAGVGVVHQDRYDILRALELADISLRQAKNAGRNKVHAVLDIGSGWSVQTVKNAVHDNRLRLATQVIVALQTEQPVADESLVRLVTDAGELVEADKFIGMAEGLGIIAELDRHMAELSMKRCVTQLAQGRSPEFAHFINLSPQFLARHDLVEELLQSARTHCEHCAFDMTSIKPLVLEITERQRIGNLDTLSADIQPLLDFGFRLALDDFGSGYSSFMYLANLPISFLKVEGWLVRNMHRERKIASIVESIVTFARNEGIVTIAEHVEDAETARILREMGVDWAQGWFYGRAQCD